MCRLLVPRLLCVGNTQSQPSLSGDAKAFMLVGHQELYYTSIFN